MADDNPPRPNGAKSRDEAGQQRDDNRIDSWKHIAVYLGRGVRTIQRWEAKGLPIHRLHHDHGETVFALKSEIDVWLLNGGHALVAETPHEVVLPLVEAPAKEEVPATPVPVAAPAPPGATAHAFLTPSWIAAIAVVVGFIGVVVTMVPRTRASATGDRNPAEAAVVGDRLQTWTLDHRPLWTVGVRGLPPDYRPDTRAAPGLPVTQPGKLRVADLDSDGTNEVLLITVDDLTSGGDLLVFNADGSVRFSHAPGRPVTYGGKVYQGFHAHQIYILPDRDGSNSVWLVSNHTPEFPSVLQEMSPTGKVLSEYWNDGYITTVRPATLRGRDVLLVGGYNNETHGGSLAVLDRQHANGSAPAENPNYRCVDCPEGQAAEFLVFPGADIMLEGSGGQGSASVMKAQMVGPRDIVTTVQQAGDAGVVTYALSSDTLELKTLLPGWGYLAAHKEFERAGRLNHAYGPAEEKALAAILRWSNGRFVPLNESLSDRPFAKLRQGPLTAHAGS